MRVSVFYQFAFIHRRFSVVHAGYARYGHKICLKMGVELYELNRDFSGDEKHQALDILSVESQSACQMFCDRPIPHLYRLFEPRPALGPNTEVVIIKSEVIAGRLASFLDDEIGKLAFKLELKPGYDGTSFIVWHGLVDDKQRGFIVEPYTSFWQRFMVGMLLLPK